MDPTQPMKKTPSDPFFGPVGKDYCLLFYILGITALILTFLAVLTTLYLGIRNKRNLSFFASGFGIALMYAISYLQNRILYNICQKDLS